MVAEWFCEVCRRTGVLVAQWQGVGFCHGVLNTDVSPSWGCRTCTPCTCESGPRAPTLALIDFSQVCAVLWSDHPCSILSSSPTDQNMSILGLTIDYGPYGWLDRYDPHHVCNGSDDSGRYDYAAQPEVGGKNCGQG